MTISKISPPAVTVLMSCYNAERWLEESINTVLNQTFKDFEFVIVDDGSKDETLAIIRQFAQQDSRIVVIEKHNTGLADSLNVGIERAQGEWIARLDADDLYEPTCLQKQVEYLRKHPEIVLLGTGFVEIDDRGRCIKEHLYPSNHRKLVRNLRRSQRFFPHSSAIFRREVARGVIAYNPLFRKSQDRDLWLRLAERGMIACLKKHLVKIRKHSEQISNSNTGISQLVYSIASSTCHFLRVNGAPDPSMSDDKATWRDFLQWVDNRTTEEGAFERRKAWADARTVYFSKESKLTAIFRFGIRLLQSGHASALVREKIFGSSLPKHLANEWVSR